jgi:hypothetical protein
MNLKLYTKQIALLTAVLGVSACSIQKDTHEANKTTGQLRDTTNEMNKETKRLSDNTEKLKQQSDFLAKRTEDLERELVTSQAYTTFLMNLDRLFNRFAMSDEQAALNKESDRTAFAAATVLAMPFQFWKGDFKEKKLEFLDWRFEMSVQPLMSQTAAHIPRDFKVDVQCPTVATVIDKVFKGQDCPSEDYKAIASIGSQLHKTMEDYNAVIQAAGYEHLNLYDVFVMALRNRKVSERKEALPRTVTVILQFQREAEYILQLRHNYLPMLILGRMSNFSEQSLLEKRNSIMNGQVLDIGWNNPNSKQWANDEQLKQWTRAMELSLQTRFDLKSMGIEPEYNQLFLKILRGVDFGQKDILAKIPANTQSAHDQLLRRFAEAYTQVVNVK